MTEKDLLEFEALKQTIDRVIFGAVDENTAHNTDDYPYGRYRTSCRWWVETRLSQGQRVAQQTLNPKTNRWNKPHYSTYSPVKFLYVDKVGHTHNFGFGLWRSEAYVNAVAVFVGEQNLTEYQKKTAKYLIASDRASKHMTWKIAKPGEPVQTLKEQAKLIGKVTAIEMGKMEEKSDVR
jgi:tRNA G18 (ribose-2'-O)-methylase SpoU